MEELDALRAQVQGASHPCAEDRTEEISSLEAVSALYNDAMVSYPVLASWENHCATQVLRALPEISGQVLDLGAGTGAIAVWVAIAKPEVIICCVEPSDAGIDRGLKETPEGVSDRIHFYQALGEALPFPDDIFDAAYSSHTFEHIENHEPVMAELRRVLKPGAPLYVIVPLGHTYDTATHCHHWSEAEFVEFFAPYVAEINAMTDGSQQIISRMCFSD